MEGTALLYSEEPERFLTLSFRSGQSLPRQQSKCAVPLRILQVPPIHLRTGRIGTASEALCIQSLFYPFFGVLAV